MNKFQILGIIAAALAFVSVVTFYMYRPKPGVDASPNSYVSQIVLSLAVGATAIALILSNSDGLDDDNENYIPNMVHNKHFDRNFTMTEGLQKQSNSGKKSLGSRLKEAGWVVCVADWCGFCTKQKELFAEHPEEELDQLIVAENDMSDEMKSRSQGFPAWMCMLRSKAESPGYKPTVADIEKLLEM